ncbi:hypothetical protein LPJ38_12775 [Bradyrhizobium daqingense]|uniref:Uncharacterized protein n=1 Tax=Bradyrhizobium daqingense TaxID=993502 RepID=A0A562KRE1_9BRAD|nr:MULTISPECIES: hypothetical protein [Bradyrhizobium]MDQ8731720.1 hypothetical protein [Bradyrhizobium sp. LHD-71]TWH97944.1 hypothetical protein IQ17_06182 [Bradyrhizobium daqingense]UFS91557.1 hypothetical protein LPJ38_12775 [Bradyrhizobium daqingense]
MISRRWAVLARRCFRPPSSARRASEPIRIGEINSYSSAPAFALPYRRGWQLAVEQLNARGGCARPFEAQTSQHPGGRIGDTPGVGAAPVALAGNTVAGEARFIETPSMQAELLGLGTTALGSMPVPPAPLTSAVIVPGVGLVGTCGIESGSDEAAVTSPPGVELHATVAPVPAGEAAGMVPIGLPA